MPIVILSVFSLASCGEDERAVSVSCERDGGTLAAKFGNSAADDPQIGYVSAGDLNPGVILQLASDKKTDVPGLQVRYLLKTTEADFLPTKTEPWIAPIVDGAFQVRTDPDVDQAARSAGIHWEKEIGENTILYFVWGARRRTLRDPLTLINSDPTAIDTIRYGTVQGPFFVIAAASYGRFEDLFYNGSSLNNVPGFILNVSYTCPAVDHVLTVARQSTRHSTMIVFYRPLKYDPKLGRVSFDTLAIARNGSIPALRSSPKSN